MQSTTEVAGFGHPLRVALQGAVRATGPVVGRSAFVLIQRPVEDRIALGAKEHSGEERGEKEDATHGFDVSNTATGSRGGGSPDLDESRQELVWPGRLD